MNTRKATLLLAAALASGCGDGTQPTSLRSHAATGSMVAPIGSAATKIYFTDGGLDIVLGGVGTIRVVNTDGTGLTTLVSGGLGTFRPRGIAVDPVNGHVYWNDFGQVNNVAANPGRTMRADITGGNVTMLVNHIQAGINDIDLDIAARHVYMALSVSSGAFHGVRRVNFDGTGLTGVVSTWPPSGPSPAGVTQGWFVDGLQIDPGNGHIYYGEIGVLTGNGAPSGVVRTNLNGTGFTSIVPHLDGRGRGIALDQLNGRIYFADHDPLSTSDGKIWRVNTDGTGLMVIVPGLRRPRDVALDLGGGKIYWIDEQTNKIQRANLDGSVVQDVVTGLSGPSSLALVYGAPPTANAGADQTVECAGPTTLVQLDGTATDPDNDIATIEWFEGTTLIATGEDPQVSLAHGTHTLTLKVTDSGGRVATDDVIIDVVDTTPPALSLNPTPGELWPPNHKYVSIDLGLAFTDACDPSSVLTASATAVSDQPDDANGNGDGNTTGDVKAGTAVSSNASPVVTFNPLTTQLQLRAERAGGTGPRTYTITVTATDSHGNTTTATATVTVPHNK